MHPPLFCSRKLAAGLTAFTLCVGLHGAALQASASVAVAPVSVSPQIEALTLPQQTDTAPSDGLLIAHHGGEATEAANALGATTTTTKGLGVSSESLWSNMLLPMVYDRDPELQALTKRMGRINALSLTAATGISAIGLAQGIDNLATLDDEPHKKHPVVLGLIGSTASLASLGTRSYFNHRYSKQAKARQTVLRDKVDNIINQLKQKETLASVEPHLAELIGPLATDEFLDLWEATHPATKTP